MIWPNKYKLFFNFFKSCGNAKNDILSDYCLHRDCGETEDLVPNFPICARRLPHDIHGCIKVRGRLKYGTSSSNNSSCSLTNTSTIPSSFALDQNWRVKRRYFFSHCGQFQLRSARPKLPGVLIRHF